MLSPRATIWSVAPEGGCPATGIAGTPFVFPVARGADADAAAADFSPPPHAIAPAAMSATTTTAG
jgi:hypothetical protein